MMLMPAIPDLETDAPIPTPVDRDETEASAWDVAWDIVDEWGAQSFPASDPPANW